MTLAEFQRMIETIYFQKDSRRGTEKTFLWLVEEVGELAEVLRKGDRANMEAEFADVMAWLFTLASMSGIEMEAAVSKYRRGCPACHGTPCRCVEP
ncbi:MAG: nucleotide pyrophosphohydrolase [Armatimonadetes bacterium]|nr:nucleotide pyrophosphohydrolase [Planctomycetota bacterium]MBI2200895.1 nucleotide pyrophosphohydrolase [Armatimonadota bacterium]